MEFSCIFPIVLVLAEFSHCDHGPLPAEIGPPPHLVDHLRDHFSELGEVLGSSVDQVVDQSQTVDVSHLIVL